MQQHLLSKQFLIRMQYLKNEVAGCVIDCLRQEQKAHQKNLKT